MSVREELLEKTRTALGRRAGQPPASLPEPRLCVPEMRIETRIAAFLEAVEKLTGKTKRAASAAEARAYVESVLAGKTAVASNAPLLRECGITSLAGVRAGFTKPDALRAACASADFGITSADYALADTGSLVMLSSHEEARLISLLPPAHIALVPRGKILTGLDELLTVMPLPAGLSSSMVLITGPSRTADIEQILVRGVHGPGVIHVLVV